MRKALLITGYVLLIPVGGALAYFARRGAFSTAGDVLLSTAYMGIALLLVRYQMRAFPTGLLPSSFSFRIRYLLKSLGCLMLAFLWPAIVSSIFGDNWIGNVLAVGPALAVVGMGAYFFYRSFPDWMIRK